MSTCPQAVTFSTEDRRALARCWHPVAVSADVTVERPTAARLLDQALVLYRSPDGLVAADDACPHRGAALSLGEMIDGRLACPYHGHRYDGHGRCVLVPANPDAPVPAKLVLRRFEVAERHGLVWVCLDPPAVAPLPAFPTYERSGFQVIHVPPFEWRCSAGRQIEAIADVAHFAFVHPVSFASADAVVGPIEVATSAHRVIHAEFTSHVANTSDRNATTQPWRRVYDLSVPFTIQVDISFPDGGTLVIFNACCPVAADRTRVFAIVSRNFELQQPVDEVIAFQMRVYEEDRRMVESQRPVALPVDLDEEVHVKADRISVEYRRQLGQLGLGRRVSLKVG